MSDFNSFDSGRITVRNLIPHLRGMIDTDLVSALIVGQNRINGSRAGIIVGVSGGDTVFCRIRIPQNGSAGADRTVLTDGNFLERAALTMRNSRFALVRSERCF